MPSLQELLNMVARSLRSPREGAEEVMAFGAPREAIWIVIALVAILVTGLNQLAVYILVGIAPEFAFLLETNLIVATVTQIVFQLLRIGAIHRIGRAMGGTGALEETAILLCWFQFVMLCVQIAALGLFMIVPFLGTLGFLLYFALSIRTLIAFVMALHGYQSAGQAVMVVIFAYMALIVLFMVFVGLLGAGVQGPTGVV